jgi:hypothetical protein
MRNVDIEYECYKKNIKKTNNLYTFFVTLKSQQLLIISYSQVRYI